MGKRIAFCCDGTWQTPRNNTNVCRIYTALRQTADQVAFYDSGVGTDGSTFDRLMGGAIGQGLLDRVTDSGESSLPQLIAADLAWRTATKWCK